MSKDSESKVLKVENEYHVASFVAHTLFEKIDDLKEVIEDTDGAEIHGVSGDGKIIFTIEGDSHQAIGRKIDQLKDHSTLVSLTPVYHQYLIE